MRRSIVFALALLLAAGAAFYAATRSTDVLRAFFHRETLERVLVASRDIPRFRRIDPAFDVGFQNLPKERIPAAAVISLTADPGQDAATLQAYRVNYASQEIHLGQIVVTSMVQASPPPAPAPQAAEQPSSSLEGLAVQSAAELDRLRADPTVSFFSPRQAEQAILSDAADVDVYIERPETMVTAWSALSDELVVQDVPLQLLRTYTAQEVGAVPVPGAKLAAAVGAGRKEYVERTLVYVKTDARTAARISAVIGQEASCLEHDDEIDPGSAASFARSRERIAAAGALPPAPDTTPTQGETNPSTASDDAAGGGNSAGAGAGAAPAGGSSGLNGGALGALGGMGGAIGAAVGPAAAALGGGSSNGGDGGSAGAPAGAGAIPCAAPRIVLRPSGAPVALGYGDDKVCGTDGKCFELARPTNLGDALRPRGAPQIAKAPKPAAIGPAQRVFKADTKSLSKGAGEASFGSTTTGGTTGTTGMTNGTTGVAAPTVSPEGLQ